ncbi:MAG: hypothetical protein K0R41_2270 [Geminicoccaceae bacterium]|nr:hypothetical protein [Geminicoccaceae bacterium]
MPEILADERIAADDLQIVASAARLADDQARLGGIAAEIERIDPLGLELVDESRVVRLTGVDRFELDSGHTVLAEAPQRLLGNALAVRLTVVDDRDVLVTPALGQVVTHQGGLDRVAAAHPEHVGESLLGQHRVARVGRDHQKASVRIDCRGRDRGAGTEVADDGGHARLHEFLGRGDRLLGIAVVIDDQQLDLLAEDAARRVQFGNLHSHALLHLLAEPGHAAGHRARRTDQDLGVAGRGGAECRSKGNTEPQDAMRHGLVSPGCQPQ